MLPAPGTALALGIKNNAGSVSRVDRESGVLRAWEPLKGEGFLGCAVIAAAGSMIDAPSADGNYLLTAKLPSEGTVVYHTGSAWDKAGEIVSAEAWDVYLSREASRLTTP